MGNIRHVDVVPSTLLVSVPTTTQHQGKWHKKSKHSKDKKDRRDRQEKEKACARVQPRVEEHRYQPRDARDLLSTSRRAPPTPASTTTTKPHPRPTTEAKRKPHPTTTFFILNTCDYCYATTTPSSTATSRPPLRESRWRQAAADHTRKCVQSPEPPRRSSQDHDTTARQPQPTDTDLRILDELRRLVGQIESRFLQIVCLSRAQEDDLRKMRWAFKRHKGNQ